MTPNNLSVVRIGDVVERVTKGTTPTTHGYRYTKEGVAFVRVENLRNGIIDSSSVTTFISADADRFLKRSSLEKDDVLVSIAGTIGRTAVVREQDLPANTNQAVAIIRGANKTFEPVFLRYALESPLLNRLLTGEARGGAMQNISLEDVKNVKVPVPPIDQQREIVAEIEKQFTRLEAGVAGLRRVQANLKRYRAAVLKAACEGNLVPTEAQWKQIPLKDLIGRISQGWSPKCELSRDALPDEWAIITTTAIQSMRYIDNQGKPLPSSLEPRPHIEIKAGDFLMTRKGPRKRAGVACLVRSTRSRLMVCDTVYRFRCHESCVVPSYLELALNSPSVVDAIDRQKAGINESGVSLTHDKLGLVLIPVPPLTEQQRIVADVERHLSVVDELEAVVNANLRRATRLRQSILQRAFYGKIDR